jgi:transposase
MKCPLRRDKDFPLNQRRSEGRISDACRGASHESATSDPQSDPRTITTWWKAAEILGVSCRTTRRWKHRYQPRDYDGRFDRRRRRPSPRKLPLALVEQVLRLYREQYQDFNVAHFCDQLREHHDLKVSYQWVKTSLQTAGPLAPRTKRGRHHQRRQRRPLRGTLLYVDGSTHAWIPALAPAQFDRVALNDDANTDCYHAQLLEQESTLTVMSAWRETIEEHGLPCSLYTDRGSHFFHTPKAAVPWNASSGHGKAACPSNWVELASPPWRRTTP